MGLEAISQFKRNIIQGSCNQEPAIIEIDRYGICPEFALNLVSSFSKLSIKRSIPHFGVGGR
ncbi:MAG: hypothetical protein D6732_02380 [Methanobacteriota archaeon]|nr:MAG: hypothetical protein D6732_02380 [Euryarchaeota archaeon]